MQESNNQWILKDNTARLRLVDNRRGEIGLPQVGTIEIGARIELPLRKKSKQPIKHLDLIDGPVGVVDHGNDYLFHVMLLLVVFEVVLLVDVEVAEKV